MDYVACYNSLQSTLKLINNEKNSENFSYGFVVNSIFM